MEPYTMNTPTIDNETKFFVHKSGHEGVIELTANGRVNTDLNERPEWAHGLGAALLAERVKFYTDRIGPEAKSHLDNNTIDMDDLSWVAFDHEGDEVEVLASNEFRMETLATLLGVDGEGEIHGAIAEKYIAEDTTWEQEAHQDQNATLAEKTGTQG
jgi:hypothetical protein